MSLKDLFSIFLKPIKYYSKLKFVIKLILKQLNITNYYNYKLNVNVNILTDFRMHLIDHCFQFRIKQLIQL